MGLNINIICMSVKQHKKDGNIRQAQLGRCYEPGWSEPCFCCSLDKVGIDHQLVWIAQSGHNQIFDTICLASV